MDKQYFDFVVQTSIMLFLILNPLGNIPAYAGIMHEYSSKDYYRIMIREMLLSLGILLTFLFFGAKILALLHISTIALSISGGIILFSVAAKMVFGSHEAKGGVRNKEPFFVPLAFPLFAGPSSITMVILTRGAPYSPLSGLLLAVLIAWTPAAAMLIAARSIEKVLGVKVLDALESLMGFLLMVMAVQMIINGLGLAFPGFLN